ncbi:L-aspartate oxidase [Mesobacillus campisalis]|uniref:L-aspartate oxidase n=1 Tax=Mesobacillus campisalis TaxID=1408103 RepID=A0A0M2SFL5_9BACI|nr:L-aspartate oxidase [Mesobacillus campisalis]KKK33078.1 L-aspartate oxidase [Mesobacillus campisalis]
MITSDVLIIGSGIAALQLAVKLRNDINVIVLTKSSVKNGNSHMAQGGVAASIAVQDDSYNHFLDTIEAGSRHNDTLAVLEMTREAPAIIEEMKDAGCQFDVDKDGELMLGREGAHSVNRIVHAGGDATGKMMVEFLISQLRENVQVVEDTLVYELLLNARQECIGVKTLASDGQKQVYKSSHVVIASGGCGQLYRYTSNADTVTGDGLALAYIAGAQLADMEFIQFHPTLLYVDGKTHGLVSEAVRGEGAVLVTGSGKRIMEDIHPMGDLAPRHIVSQTIYDYLKNGEPIYLDISSISHFETRFPTVSGICRDAGIDLEEGKIPVAPGSHFLMGGIKTDHFGQTTVSGLYAIGEASCTGVHGANRLASNSLLEGLVYGRRLAHFFNSLPPERLEPDHEAVLVEDKKTGALPLPEKAELQRMMMERAGIVRHGDSLNMHKKWLESFQVEKWLDEKLDSRTPEEITRAFMLISAWLVTDAALARTESRGGHFRADFPAEEDEKWLKQQIVNKRMIKKGDMGEPLKAALTT